jgi:C-terminal processing protease CtpA/Prc
MRKASLIILGATAGSGLTLLVMDPRAVSVGSSAEAALSDTYKQLNLFGEVFERVRADYVEKPDDGKLVQSAINGMLAGLDPQAISVSDAFLDKGEIVSTHHVGECVAGSFTLNIFGQSGSGITWASTLPRRLPSRRISPSQ